TLSASTKISMAPSPNCAVALTGRPAAATASRAIGSACWRMSKSTATMVKERSMGQASPRIWLIAGPTASGKSALALRLAQAIGGEIINADSMQLYAELRVLTARPGAQDEA